MANLRSIKDRITSIKNTQKITKAMKMVAAAKVKKAENAVRASRPFTINLYKMFCSVYEESAKNQLDKVNAVGLDNYPELLKKREVKKVGLVIVSSNKGLAGAYSANIVRYSLNMIKKLKSENKQVVVYFVGQKAVAPIKNAQKQYDFEIKNTYTSLLDGINSSSAFTIASDVANDYIEHNIDEIHLVTTRYKNMMSYKTEDWQLLPAITDTNKIKEFRNEELDKELNIEQNEDKIAPLGEYLPSINSVLETIVPMFITNVIYQALLEAQASELASRMTAMSSATNNAADMISTLTIEYNKARQANITQELTEIIGGSNALN